MEDEDTTGNLCNSDRGSWAVFKTIGTFNLRHCLWNILGGGRYDL